MFVLGDGRFAEARRLREVEGWSIKRIAREVHAAQSTVSLWVRDVELTRGRRRALRDWAEEARRAAMRVRRRRRADSAPGRRRRVGIARARLIPCTSPAACSIGEEGSKSRNHVEFVNSDAGMVVLFVRFLRACYRMPHERIRVTCKCLTNNGIALEAIERRALAYGTVRVTVNSTAIVQSIYGAIQEYAGIERPEWLDGR
jgi:hypothetical protein